MEFKSFEKIQNIKELKKFLNMTITQKIHGTNAHVYIEENGNIRVGSRNRWIFPEDDNYGFANFVQANKDDFVRLLGPGRHDGEWCGKGINSGEGLEEKTFVLFDWWRWQDKELPKNVTTVPVLYTGPLDMAAVDKIMENLKSNGSYLSPGFMKPEGVVVSVGGKRFKKVFEAEETGWTKISGQNKGQNKKEIIDYSYLCQPVRLEKLLSRDQRYLENFPQSLPDIVKDYVADLIEENQIEGDEDKIKAVKKGASKQIFSFVREIVGKAL